MHCLSMADLAIPSPKPSCSTTPARTCTPDDYFAKKNNPARSKFRVSMLDNARSTIAVIVPDIFPAYPQKGSK